MVFISFNLCNACATGNLLEIITLLQNGADVNGENVFNRTAIQVVKLGDSRVIETLLRAGANPNVPDPSCGLTVTHDAAREGFVDSVRALLTYGADVNIADEKGNLPLHLAASKGHLEVVRLLIGYTENRGVRNNDGLTAEQLARGNNHTDTATFIQNHQ